MKKRFAEKAAPMVKTAVEKTLNKEISQLRDDITSAREVNFGRRIFEAFANEFQTSYLMEKSEIAKLKKQIAHKDTELTEAQDKIAETTTLVESKDAEIRIAQDKVNRGQIVSELLSPVGLKIFSLPFSKYKYLAGLVIKNTQTQSCIFCCMNLSSCMTRESMVLPCSA